MTNKRRRKSLPEDKQECSREGQTCEIKNEMGSCGKIWQRIHLDKD